ncbi:MAG: cobyric acid synthase [Spirochaetaceae bacterium]|nr:cobyric acid synthase [Spirochaetaceae bacterium]
MVQGTASSVGKSLVAAALCRAYARLGLRVAPFKAQNMSNNAAATADGGEIGRAQALQAAAARIPPGVDMNPVLLKPEAEARSQVVVLGKPYKTLPARDYYLEKPFLWKTVTAALDRLRASADLVVVEGAGSPAEINLRGGDIVNMAIARYANSPVLLVADIDPGGVFAQVVGTLALLEEEERDLVKGVIVNKFRGDLSLLEPGLQTLRGLTGKPVLGVLPYLRGVGLAEEDGAVLETRAAARARLAGPAAGAPGGAGIDIAVLRLPRVANFDDLDALSLEAGVSVRFVAEPGELGLPDAVIVPGSKATLADLDWMRRRGFDDALRWLSRLGVAVVGLCGGYQILGRRIEDPEGVEGPPRSEPGLGLLPVETVFRREKSVRQASGAVLPGGPGFFAAAAGLPVAGYEIHAGETRFAAAATHDAAPADGPEPAPGEAFGLFGLADAAPADGASSLGGRVWGSYLHGVFDLPDFRRAWLASLGADPSGAGLSLEAARDAALDRLADAFEASIDLDQLSAIIGIAQRLPPGPRRADHTASEEP